MKLKLLKKLIHNKLPAQGMAINGSSRIIGEIEASNGIVYVVSNQIIEDIFFMLPFMPRTLGVDVFIMIKALEISGVSNMINQCNEVID